MKKYWLLLLVLPSSVLFSALGIHLLEGYGESPFASLFNSVWWTIVTFTTVGYGDMSPVTVHGRLFGILVLVGGVMVNSVIISLVTNLFFAYESSRTRGLKSYKLRNHVLVCSDNPDFILSVVEENQHYIDNSKLAIISPTTEHPLLSTDYASIPWINGEAFHVKPLARASAKYAKVAYTNFSDDSSSVMTIMQLESLTNYQVVSSTMCTTPDYVQYLEQVGTDFALNFYDIYVPLMFKAFRSPVIPLWIRQIVLRHAETPVLENHPVPPIYRLKTYSELLQGLLPQGKWFPMGVIDDGNKVVANPPGKFFLTHRHRVITLIRPQNPAGQGFLPMTRAAEPPLTGNILILSDQRRFIVRMLKELSVSGVTDPIIVVTERDRPLDLPQSLDLTWHAAMSYSNEACMLSNAHHTKAAFIDHQEDKHTLMAVLRLENITRGRVITIASYRETDFDQRLKEVGCDFCINVGELTTPILVQSAYHQGVGVLVENIISQAFHTQSLFLRKLTETWEPMSWLETVLQMKEKYEFLPVGLVKNDHTQLYVNPDPQLAVEPNDSLIFLAASDR